MASWLLMVAAALAADKNSRSESMAAVNERGFHEYQHEISELLKRESQAKEPRARAAAVRAMCDLHADIVHDSRYANSDVLKEYRGRLWSRLVKIKTEIKQQLARSKANKESLDSLAVLESANSESIAAADTLATSLSMMDQLQGGPLRLLAFGGAAGPPDFGPDLVALIERTINPAFWDTVGGPGSILYYQPLMCLVVRATGEVHEQIGGVLGGLRK
jgi:hypothetical protein